MVFFVILSIYFLINDKIALSGISLGLSVLAKYNGIFIAPVLLFIVYKKYGNKNLFLKKSLILILLSLLIASPWLVRNWILLGNPVWPFVNFIFRGIASNSYSQANWNNLARPDLYISTYLGIFGVPDGNINSFSFIKMPFYQFLVPLWVIGTAVFIAPFLIGIFKSKKNKDEPKNNNLNWILLIWIIPYLILFAVYAANVGTLISRIILPIFPALAIFWAYGFDYLRKKNYGKWISIIIVLIILGLVSSEYFKTNIAANSWNKYSQDFDWVKSNTSPNSVFLLNGQCIPYNIERTSLYANNENLNKTDYLWVNQNFALDRRSMLNNDELNLVQSQNPTLVYSNKETGTAVYQIKR